MGFPLAPPHRGHPVSEDPTGTRGFPGGSVVKNPPANVGDSGCLFKPWSGRSPRVGSIYKACELPQWLSDKESAQNAGDVGSVPGSGRPPGRRKRQPTPVFLPEKFHGQRSWADHSSWGHQENWTQRPQQQYGTQSHTRGQAHTLTCSDFFFPRSDNIIHTVLQLAFSLNISWAFFHSKTYVLK